MVPGSQRADKWHATTLIMVTMNIHYTIVINKMKENQGLQMGQKFRKLSKEKNGSRRKKENTYSLRSYYLRKGRWVETLI